jgi:hypothetical protein
MSLLSTLLKKYIGDVVTTVNAQLFVHDRLAEIAAFVAGTENQIDDAVFAEISLDVDFDTLTANTVIWARAWLGLGGGVRGTGTSTPSVMFAPRPMQADGRLPGLFLGIVRGRMATELAKKKGISRSDARTLVNAKSDDEILRAAEAAGAPMGAIGDGTILNWLIAHGPDILALIMKILPLLFLL